MTTHVNNAYLLEREYYADVARLDPFQDAVPCWQSHDADVIVHYCTICKQIIQDMPDGHSFTHASAYQWIAMTRDEVNKYEAKLRAKE